MHYRNSTLCIPIRDYRGSTENYEVKNEGNNNVAKLFIYEISNVIKKNDKFCGLYCKTITIVIMTIVSDATIWSITYDRN